MDFNEFAKLAPADAPVASVVLRENVVDVYRIKSGVVISLLARAPEIYQAWKGSGKGNLGDLAGAVALHAPDALKTLLSEGLRTDKSTLESVCLTLDEEIEVVTAIVNHSIPDELKKKALAGLGALTKPAKTTESTA